MNLNRSRVAVAGTLSAALLVGMPVATAAGAAAVQDPGQLLDDPPPADGTPEGAERPALATLELFDAQEEEQTLPDLAETQIPPGKEDIDRPGLVVESTVNQIGDPLTDPQRTLDLSRERAPEAGDATGDRAGEDTGEDAPTSDGPTQGEVPGEEDATQDAPTGDLDETQTSRNRDERAQATADSARNDAAAAPRAVETTTVDSTRTAVTGEAAERSSAMALAGSTIGGVLPTGPMPKAGAAAIGLLQTGLGLIGLGGLLIAGTGRHRRMSEARAQTNTLGI